MIYKVIGRENIAVGATAVGFTASQLTVDVVYAMVQVLPKKADGNTAGAIKCTEAKDATPVAVTTGFLFNPGDIFDVWGNDALAAFLAIEETATAAYLEVVYYGRG